MNDGGNSALSLDERSAHCSRGRAARRQRFSHRTISRIQDSVRLPARGHGRSLLIHRHSKDLSSTGEAT